MFSTTTILAVTFICGFALRIQERSETPVLKKISRATFGDYNYVTGSKHASVADAEKECVAMNGHLLSIHSAEEQNFVNSYFSDKYWFWIGLKRYNNRWNWTDGTPFNFENWGKLDPFDNIEGETAAYIYMARDYGTWASEQPTLTDVVNIYPSFCKIPTRYIPIDSPTTVRRVESCHRNYALNGYCYLFADGLTGFKWQEEFANEIAESCHLVSIHSQTEQTFVESFIKSWPSDYVQTEFWIGLQNKNGKYTWIDGSPLDYTNWAPNQPAYIDGSECVVIPSKTTTKWYTKECNGMFIGVLKKKPWIDVFDE